MKQVVLEAENILDDELVSVAITPKVEIIELPPPPLLIAKHEPTRLTTMVLESQPGLTPYRRQADEQEWCAFGVARHTM